MPLLHARDAALGKAASIGTVNPRRGGPINGLVQIWKQFVARTLDWHVREQIVFNRRVMDCFDTVIEALNENNRGLTELAGRSEEWRLETEELKDIRKHWTEWRAGWESKLRENEVQFLRNVAELHAAFQHRVTLMDAQYRETAGSQHRDFTAALREGMDRVRLEYERLIHSELRLIRQRVALQENAAQPAVGNGTHESGGGLPFDYGRFAERFRGSEEYVRAGQHVYVPYFRGRSKVLDIGCGRGEFLELMRDAGVNARGIEISAESIALCRHKGLAVEAADLYSYLSQQPEQSLDGIFCAQVVEHLPPERLPEMIKLAASRLASGGIIAIETPNPECLAIFATHFYLDPTHQRPVPHPLLAFYLEEFGVGNLEVKKLAPAVETMPVLATLPEEFRNAFFGGLDYAVIGTKL